MPIVVDFIQVAQYVSEAALALFPDNPPEQDHWVQAHLPEILRGKASLVARASDKVPHCGGWRQRSASPEVCVRLSPPLHAISSVRQGAG